MATRGTLRRNIASLMRDFMELTATHDGADSNFIDHIRLIDPTNTWAGSWGIVVSAGNAANVGKLFRVIASSAQAGSLSFSPNLPDVTLAGDVVHLYSLSGKGFSIDVYNTAINDVLENTFPEYVSLDFLDNAVMSDSGEIDAPAGWYFVYDVKYQEGDTWRQVLPMHLEADLPREKICIRASSRSACEEADSIRIYGAKRPVLPTDDATEVSIPKEFVEYAVASMLARRRTGHREWIDAGRDWQNQANAMRGWIRQTQLPLKRIRW